MTTNTIDTYKSLGLSASDTGSTVKKQTLGQEQFLKLLTTQMTHQDPTKPMDNTAFLSQMAQFSTVSGIQDLQASFKDFANSLSSSQSLQAAGLVGHQVSAPSKVALLSAGGTVSGDFALDGASTSTSLKIINSKTGETVRDIDLGAQSAGTTKFEWDGKDDNGVAANPGIYKIQASAWIDGTNTALATNVQSLVKSVTMGSSGLQVNLDGVGTVKFSQIKQIL